MTPALIFPPTELKLRKYGTKFQVCCLIRRKWLVLTPEEWVRQHVIGYLIKARQIPIGSIAVEKSFQYLNRKKRWDIVSFNREGEPEILVECKAPMVPIDQTTLYQISAYQQMIKAKKLILTNGMDCFVFDYVMWRQGIESI